MAPHGVPIAPSKRNYLAPRRIEYRTLNAARVDRARRKHKSAMMQASRVIQPGSSMGNVIPGPNRWIAWRSLAITSPKERRNENREFTQDTLAGHCDDIAIVLLPNRKCRPL